MEILKIKSLSVNDAWRGKRFKSSDYKKYEQDLFLLLPKIKIPKGKLHLTISFGFSSKGSDVDNPVKPFVDVLQKAYGFNDNQIYYLEVIKIDVEKKEEFIAFSIEKY